MSFKLGHVSIPEKFQKFKYGTFMILSLKLIQWYVTSVSRGSLYEKFGNKCAKILKFLRTELSYAQNKKRGKKMRLLGMDTCPSLNDIMEIRCNKCTRSEQGYIVDHYCVRFDKGEVYIVVEFIVHNYCL
jgi:hypothetical protein